jgi:hypothetical protein
MAKEYGNPALTSPADKEASEVTAAVIDLFRRAGAQAQAAPELTGGALEARNRFAQIAEDLKVTKF